MSTGESEPMTESTSTQQSRGESYLLWRQRLADRQVAWRQPEETGPKPSSEWDPAALFVKNEPVATSTVDEAGSQTIDLRTDPPSVAASKPAAPAPHVPTAKANRPESRAPHTAAVPKHAPRSRTTPPEPEPLDRQAQFDSVMARLERRSARSVPKQQPPPIGAALRDLNQLRLDGLITDDEFKARKAELFRRSPRH